MEIDLLVFYFYHSYSYVIFNPFLGLQFLVKMVKISISIKKFLAWSSKTSVIFVISILKLARGKISLKLFTTKVFFVEQFHQNKTKLSEQDKVIRARWYYPNRIKLSEQDKILLTGYNYLNRIKLSRHDKIL